MEIITLKKDGSRWIKLSPEIDNYHNLDDYENWLMDASLNFRSTIRSMSSFSIELENVQHEYYSHKKLQEVNQ